MALKGQGSNPEHNHRYRRPAHSACVFKSDDEQRAAVDTFLSEGLAHGEKCLYLLDDRSQDEVLDSLSGRGGVEEAAETGQLTFLESEESYLKDDHFDPDRMLGLIRGAHKAALAEGYRGFRATGEMSWHKAGRPGSERLMEYEARVNHLNPELGADFLCQYGESSFDNSVLLDVLHTHPHMVIRGERCANPYFVSPNDFLAMRSGKTPREVYENRMLDILKRARFSMIHRMELRELRSSRAKLDAMESEVIPDVRSIAEIACFYAELAKDNCSDPSTISYIEEVAKSCRAIQSRLRRSPD